MRASSPPCARGSNSGASSASATIAAAQADCRLASGERIEVFANLTGTAADATLAVAQGAEGCGLLRTEFLFLERDTAPDEDEQLRCYQQVAPILGSRPLVIRTLDIGGDKPIPYLPLPPEDNPGAGLARRAHQPVAAGPARRAVARDAARCSPRARCASCCR